MRLNLWVSCLATVWSLAISPAAAAETVLTVDRSDDAAFQSIQAAIDAAPEGATVRVGPGIYDGGLVIRKPLTLEGAGWDRTTIAALQPAGEQIAQAAREAERQMRQAMMARNPAQAQAVRKALEEQLGHPTVRIESAAGVSVRRLKIAAQPIHSGDDGAPRSPTTLLQLTDSRVSISDCVITGSPGDGIQIKDGCDVDVRNTLVAGLWGNGIVVGLPDRADTCPRQGRPCKLVLADSDVRNCYHYGVYVNYTADVTVERCRISGSAWHGIRYGGGPQKILNSRFSQNARCGIYADGSRDVAATIRGNVFAGNEGTGIACFSGNAEIVGNTFADNASTGINVLGPARATIERNVFVSNEAGVLLGSVNNGKPGPREVGQARMRDNVFWWNKEPVQLATWDRDNGAEPPPTAKLDAAAGNVLREVKFAGGDGAYVLPPESPERATGIGAPNPLPEQTPFPLQPQEESIIPASATRDWRAWRRPALEPLRVAKIELPAAPPPADKATYFESFADLHEVLGRDYPCFQLKKIDWKAVGDELLPRAKQVDNEKDFGLLCMELVARLEDSHAFVGPGAAQPPRPELPSFDPGFACLLDGRGKPVIYHVDPRGPAAQAGVRPGMTVVSVDGKAAAEVMAARMKELSRYAGYSSDRYLRYHAAQFLPRVSERGKKVNLELEDTKGVRRGLLLPATLPVRYLPRLPVPIKGIRDDANVAWTMLDDTTGYLYVRRIQNDLIDQLDRAVADLKNAKAMIIDVRGNSGGGFDAARSFRNFHPNDQEEPNRPRFLGPMAVLIDSRCISAGEGWSSWFVANKRAKFFGEATAGASSRKRQHVLKNGLYTVTFPVKAYTGFLDRPIERRGLEPDAHVRQSAADLAAGRDTVLETAREYLQGKIK